MVEGTTSDGRPTVTIAIPTLNEEGHLEVCLGSIEAQDYPAIIEVLVADGRSGDRTREIAERHPGVRVVDNPRRIRPAGLNRALAEASGEIFVRVDARATIAPDYVTRSVEALEETGAVLVGGPMIIGAETAAERGIAAAMCSRLGGGPAAFRRTEGGPRFVDTVYLGAFRTEVGRRLGGYDELSGGNEDAEFAIRARAAGGVWLDPGIRSRYAGREGLRPLARQYMRYGRNRTRTMRKHPGSISPRQLAVPMLAIGLLSPWRRYVTAAYLAAVGGRGAIELSRDPAAAPTFVAALPTMHAAWGAGMVVGLLGPNRAKGHGPEEEAGTDTTAPGARATKEPGPEERGPEEPGPEEPGPEEPGPE